MNRLRLFFLDLLAGVWPARAAFLGRAIGPLEIREGSRVVVFGAGSAALVRQLSALAGPSGEVAVLFRHPGRGRRLQKQMLRAGVANVTVRRLDGFRTELPGGRYDRGLAVFFLDTLSYAARAECLTELRRIVAPGVSVLVLDFRRPEKRPFVETVRALRVLFPDPEGFRSMFRPGGLPTEVRDSGFAIRHRHDLGPLRLFEALVLEKLPPRGPVERPVEARPGPAAGDPGPVEEPAAPPGRKKRGRTP